MYKKFISTILVMALMNLMGCTAYKSFAVDEFKQVKEQDEPAEFYVKTTDSREYFISDPSVFVKNDTLYGKGILVSKEFAFDGKIAVRKIKTIQFKDIGSKYPSIYNYSQYQKIESETGKPDEILITTNDVTKYRFLKDDYYIKNDTFYGKGIMISGGEGYVDLKIAIADIEIIEYEYFNWIYTGLYTVALGLSLVGGLLLILYLGGAEFRFY